MQRIILGIVIMAAIMLAGCNKAATHVQIETPTIVREKEENSNNEKIEQLGQLNSKSNNIKTYDNETHKKIEYGKISLNFDSYHIVSYIQSDNSATFKCEIDKGIGWSKTHMTITIREMEKRDFLNVESATLYLRDNFPDYEQIVIYNNIADDSGITSLYRVTKGDLTNYIVFYSDVCYLIESDYNVLSTHLFKNRHKENYVEYNQKIKCANSFTAYVKKSIFYDSNKAKYDILQGKDGTKYFIDINRDEKSPYNITIKNEGGENLLILSTYASDFNEIIKFLDVNMDGYADIQFLKEAGTMNNSYDLYVWDGFTKSFIKVKCDEMISYFKVHEGYLLNWGKNDAKSGVVQKLVWEGNTLIKESEEHYQVDE